jgi:hypothetical protein
MTEPVPAIDYTSRDYSAIRSDLLNAIPVRLPNWTSQDPSDFGVVLVELFAYVGDLLNFYIDRIANEVFLSTATQRSSVIKMAELIDYQPIGNQAASTNVTFTIPSGNASAVAIPAGTQVSTQGIGSVAPVVFETQSNLNIYGQFPVLVSQTTYGTGASGLAILLTQPFDGVSETVTISGNIWTNSVFASVTATSSTAIAITVPSGFAIPTNGVGTTVSIPINGSATAFTYSSTTGSSVTPTLIGVSPNPTGAVGKIATITFGSLTGVGPTNEYYIIGNTLYFGNGINGNEPGNGIVISITYKGPVNYSGTVLAIQGQTVTEQMAVSSGAPNQSYPLVQSPIINGTVSVTVNSGGNNLVPWVFFTHLGDAGPLDLAFTTATDENGAVNVIFGDGVTGSIPSLGAILTATYRIGGGTSGNVGANTITQILTSGATPVGTLVLNSLAALGGADPEDLNHIRINAPRSLRALNRAVTLEDYATLAVQGMGGGRAAAQAQTSSVISLYINPPAGFYLNMSQLLNDVNSYGNLLTNSGNTGFLDTKKMANSSIVILPPTYLSGIGYVPVNFNIGVNVASNYSQSVVLAAVYSALSNTSQTGLLDFPQVDFGMILPLSLVYTTLFQVPGVNFLTINEMCRAEVSPATAEDIICQPYEIPQINTASGTVVITALSS